MKATLIKECREPGTFKRLPDQQVEIEAATQDELLALFFREHDNRYKYCSTISYQFADPALTEAYREWRSDVNNYIANGGDMW